MISRLKASAATVVAHCLPTVVAFVSSTSYLFAEDEPKPGEAELTQAVKVLQMEGAPAAQGNSDEAVQLCEMFSVTARVAASTAAAEGDDEVTAPLPDQRQFCYLEDSQERCVFLILRDDLGGLPEERRKFFLGMSVGMAHGVAKRFGAIEELAVGVVWDGEVRWTTVSKRGDDGEFANEHFEGAEKAAQALSPFFADEAAE